MSVNYDYVFLTWVKTNQVLPDRTWKDSWVMWSSTELMHVVPLDLLGFAGVTHSTYIALQVGCCSLRQTAGPLRVFRGDSLHVHWIVGDRWCFLSLQQTAGPLRVFRGWLTLPTLHRRSAAAAAVSFSLHQAAMDSVLLLQESSFTSFTLSYFRHRWQCGNTKIIGCMIWRDHAIIKQEFRFDPQQEWTLRGEAVS